MNRKTLIAVAGTAVLAFGSGAHAIMIDNEYSVTYAKETLQKADESTQTVGGVTYYVLAPMHAIAGPADITANSTDTDDYDVLFTLQNMVFATPALTSGSLTTTMTAEDGRSGASFTLVRGGAVDDNFVVFSKAQDDDIKATDELTLAAKFAVTADGPGGITRMVTNEALPSNLPGIMVSMTHRNPDAVKVIRALKETVTLPMMAMADASDDFMSFTGGTAVSPNLRAPVGTLMIGVESGIRDARVESDTIPNDMVDTTIVSLLTPRAANGDAVVDNNMNTGIIATGALDDASTAGSAVTFSGEFSFLKTLALGSSASCSGSLTEIRKQDEDDRTILLDETMPKGAGEFAAGMTLCVAVDGETAIPKTGAYTALTEYKGPDTAKFPPVGATHYLGMIGRSGSTFRLPFLTVHERHNQRINIVNRGRATTYTLGELATKGDSVSALDMASGDLPQGQTVLLVSDLIEVTGAMRAAGTLSMPADEDTLDVSIDIINRENGSSDTVYVDAD
jgi:hypothetical protein